jgi:hypothetical protein
MNRGSSMGINLAEAEVSGQHQTQDTFSNGHANGNGSCNGNRNAGGHHTLQSPNTDGTLSQEDRRIPDNKSGSMLMSKLLPPTLHLNTNITNITTTTAAAAAAATTTTASELLPLPSLSLPPVPSLPSPISPLTSPISTHFPNPPDPSVGFGNTGLAILRVWWKEPAEYPFNSIPGAGAGAGAGAAAWGGLQARGRVEMWGEVSHLMDDSYNDDESDDDGLHDDEDGQEDV